MNSALLAKKQARLERKVDRALRLSQRPKCYMHGLDGSCNEPSYWQRKEMGKWVHYCKKHAPRDLYCAHHRRCWKPAVYQTGFGAGREFWCEKHYPKDQPDWKIVEKMLENQAKWLADHPVKPEAKWTVESGQELVALYGADAEEEIIKCMSERLSLEIDKAILEDSTPLPVATPNMWDSAPSWESLKDSILNVQPMTGPVSSIEFYRPKFTNPYFKPINPDYYGTIKIANL